MKDILLIQKIEGNELTLVRRTGEKLSIIIQEGCMWEQFLPLLERFDQLYLDGQSVKERVISDTSIFVIDPHYLVPVTSIVDAYSCPRKVYVKHMGATEFDKMDRVVEGNLLHDVFSQKLALKTPVPDAIENALKAHQVAIITNGLSQESLKEYLQKNARVFQMINAEGESEVDFENWRYGFHGKLDGKVNSMVFELKSSKIPDEKPYFSHNLQMNYYLYMIKEREENTGKVFYVSNGSMKMHEPTPMKLRRMLAARNYTYLVVSGRYEPPLLRGKKMKECRYCFQAAGCMKLCAGTEIQRDCSQCYLEKNCNKEAWKDEELEYFELMVQSINAEQNIDSREKYTYSRGGSYEEKDIERMVKSGHAIITQKKISEELVVEGVVTKYKYTATKTIYRKGDFVNGYPRDELHNVVTKFHSLVILEITDTEITLRSSNYMPTEICIVPSINPGMHRRSRSAVYRATQINDKLMNLIKISLKEKLVQKELDWKSRELSSPLKEYNAYQLSAIKSALVTDDVLLIQGPAGTGKTSVIVEIIHQLHQQGKSVLASAFTNMAVDNIGLKLLESGIPFIRLGREQSVSAQLRGNLPDDPTTFSAIFMQLEPKVILATTTSVAGDQYRDLVFDYAVIDEAAQMTEPDTLKPLLLARKAILVGDHKQLPPVIRSDIAIENKFDQSMFERLKDRVATDHFIMLVDQYRMNNQILEFPNKQFYEGLLKSATKEIENQSLLMEKSSFLPQSPYVLFNIDSPHLKDDNMTNPQEAWLTALIVVELLRQSPTLKMKDIGVITPFRAQVALLRKIIPKIAIDTVDRFQGSEREVIIFSTITSRNVPIVTDPRRMNVALTRAKKKLIVLATNPSRRELSITDKLAADALSRGLSIKVNGRSTDVSQFISQFMDYKDFSVHLRKIFGDISIGSMGTDEYDDAQVSMVRVIRIYLGTIPLPFGKYGEIAEEEEGSSCSICYKKIESNEEAFQCLGCAYFYHHDHLILAVKTVPHCPICKSGLRLVDDQSAP